MSTSNHPIEQEELMAYLDGELETERASAAVSHLEHCQECQRLTADLRDVSEAMRTWQVPYAVKKMPEVEVALEEYTKQDGGKRSRGAKWQAIERRTQLQFRLLWGFAGASMAILVLGGIILLTTANQSGQVTSSKNRSVLHNYTSRNESESSAAALLHPNDGAQPNYGTKASSTQMRSIQSDSDSSLNELSAATANVATTNSSFAYFSNGQNALGPTLMGGFSNVSTAPVSSASSKQANESGTTLSGPMIERVAALIFTAKEFDRARASIETILNRHHGYIGELGTDSSSGAGRTLTAKLRVPADQLDAVIVELRPIGTVESEAQSGNEVTQQYVDLQARIANAHNTEKRLNELLHDRRGKLSDVLEVEQEIDRVSGEIETMEAERKNMAKQVDFATLSVTVNEVYKAPMQVVPVSTSTRLSNAVVGGFRMVADGIINLLLFLASYGPSMLLWCAILFFPVRALLRKARQHFGF